MPGMPLVYSGNEYGLKHSLKFFEKDSIPKIKGKEWELRAKLGQLKTENLALNGGKNPASYKRIKTNDDTKILAFEREKDGKKIIYIANLSNQTIETKIQLKGDFADYISGYKIQFRSDAPIGLKAWQYLILTE